MAKRSILFLILFGISNTLYSQSILDVLEKKINNKLKQREKKEERSLERKVDKGIDKVIDEVENSFIKSKNAVSSGYKYSEIKESDFYQTENVKEPMNGFSRLKIANNLFLHVKGVYPKGYNPNWRFISYRSELQYEVADWVFQNAHTKYDKIAFTLGDYDGKAIIEFKPYIGSLGYAVINIKDMAVISEKPQTFKITNFEKVVNNRMSGEQLISLNNAWYMNGGFEGRITLSCDEDGNIKMDLLIESYSKKESRGRTYHEPQVYKAFHAKGIKIDNEMSPAKAIGIIKAEQEAKQRQKDYEVKTIKQADILQKNISKKYQQSDCKSCFYSSRGSYISSSRIDEYYVHSGAYAGSHTNYDINTKTVIKNKCNYSLMFIGIQQLNSEEKGYYLEEVTKTMPVGYDYSTDQGLVGTLFTSLLGGNSEFNFAVQDKYVVKYASVGSVQWLRVIKAQ